MVTGQQDATINSSRFFLELVVDDINKRVRFRGYANR